MSLRVGCFVLLCFKIQHKMILSEIPRNIIWGKDNRMLNELYSRACYFYPHSSSPLACPRAAVQPAVAARGPQRQRPSPGLAGGAPSWRRKAASPGLWPGGTVPHPHPEGLWGWHRDPRGDDPGCSWRNGFTSWAGG